MSDLTLVIGNKNISSWSFRPWILLKQAGIPFQEVSLKLFTPEYASVIAKYSPSGKVPVLHDGDLQVWDTLSISEYLAEKFPNKNLWPKEVKARAKARSAAAEMHSGFTAMRSNMSMNFWGRFPGKELLPEALKDVERISSLWLEFLQEYGGPFLFGKEFSIADAFYSPVVSRFVTYGISLQPKLQDYVNTITSLPAYKEWGEGAQKEIS